MTNTASAQTGNFWDVDFVAPQPTQDSDLLKQLPFVPGLKEMLMLRQVHALEHATVWVLAENARLGYTASSPNNRQLNNDAIGGLSTEEGFYLYGQVKLVELKRAVPTALERLTSGEWDLAVHPRCGTNLSVGMFLTAVLAFGAHLVLPRGPIEQMLGLGLATATATQIAPDVGSLAQKYLTTSIPFNLAIEEITATSDLWERPSHFVKVHWKS
ncbi:DUF6391 domain-containing protein [Lyngbya aestuarii]|uniref:DUF6391 domain-containing protein n=1 Tax=Lyngbya aestuarii TaxID=118322 RepID=UPI00403E0469